MSNQKNTGSISGKGYYIALILCAVAIGITGYLYYRNADDAPVSLEETQPLLVDATADGDNVEAVAPPATGTAMEDTVPPTVGPKPKKTASPVSGETVAEYAMDCLSYNQTTRDWRVHNGVDIAAPAGADVCAAADGTVYTVYEDESMGMTVVIRHEGDYTTRYSSLAETVSVKPGDTVSVGQTIGQVGNTALMESAIGDHVHFSVSCGGTAVDPADFLS